MYNKMLRWLILCRTASWMCVIRRICKQHFIL